MVDGDRRLTEFAVKPLPVRVVVDNGHNLVPAFPQHLLHDVAHFPVS